MNRPSLHSFLLCSGLGSVGCGYTGRIPVSDLREVPPPANAVQVDGTYADHSPSEFGGSIWEMLTGQYRALSNDGQTRIRVLPGDKLDVARLETGVEVERRQVPFKVDFGYVRISRSRFWTLLLVSGIGVDEVAVAGSGDRGLKIYQSTVNGLFITFVPLIGDSGPPPYWHDFPPTRLSQPLSKPSSRSSSELSAGDLM